ncbi:MAG: UDP-glucose 4-epimerase, partial [Planctomycetes bacterium]|nr:UDP-glucose 4-epimerase [Planctomycetota bacterium]
MAASDRGPTTSGTLEEESFLRPRVDAPRDPHLLYRSAGHAATWRPAGKCSRHDRRTQSLDRKAGGAGHRRRDSLPGHPPGRLAGWIAPRTGRRTRLPRRTRLQGGLSDRSRPPGRHAESGQRLRVDPYHHERFTLGRRHRGLARQAGWPAGAGVKILVTGGAGYVGSHCVRGLCDAGHEVVVLDDLSTGHRRAVDDRAAFIQGDLGDRAVLDKALTDQGVDAVMHFAASLNVNESVRDPLAYYRNNVVNSVALLESMHPPDVHKIVF